MTAQRKVYEFEKQITGPKMVNLALQGGGSHGAFTWGVLDRLLEEDCFAVDGITATSAGSINAVLLAYGLSVGGREGAKEALGRFWRRMSALMTSSIVQPSILDKMRGNFGLDYSPGYILMNMLCQIMSPYQLNPCNLNPLKRLLEEIIDFRTIRQQNSRQIVPLRNQCSDLQTGSISQSATHRRPRAGFFMPAILDACGRDRRGALLGWGFYRQSRPFPGNL